MHLKLSLLATVHGLVLLHTSFAKEGRPSSGPYADLFRRSSVVSRVDACYSPSSLSLAIRATWPAHLSCRCIRYVSIV